MGSSNNMVVNDRSAVSLKVLKIKRLTGNKNTGEKLDRETLMAGSITFKRISRETIDRIFGLTKRSAK